MVNSMVILRFANTEVETEIYIVNKPLETLISGATAEALGIIPFNTINTVQPAECNKHSETNNVPIFPFYLRIFCPGTMTILAESINSDLQRGLDRRLRHTQH